MWDCGPVPCLCEKLKVQTAGIGRPASNLVHLPKTSRRERECR